MAHVLFADLTTAGLHTVRRALELGHRVTLVLGEAVQYYHPDATFERLRDQVHQVVPVPDAYDVEQLGTAIAAVHAEHPIDGFVCQFDPVFEPLAIVCARMGLPWTSVEGIRTARDKSLTRRALERAGLASARYAVVHDPAAALRAAAEIGYPVVIKPVRGIDSVMSFTANDPAALREAARTMCAAADDPNELEVVRRLVREGLLIEEYLSGELVSAEVARRDGRNWRFLICGRSRAVGNDCVEMGAAMPADVSPQTAEACFDYAEAVCDAVGLDLGVFHVEMMLTPRGPVLVEVNARVMGGVMTLLYKLLTGVDFCDYVLEVYLGDEPQPRPLAGGGRTVTARRLMPQADGRLAETVDLAWVDDPGEAIVHFESFNLAPAAEVRRQEVIGRFTVFGDDWGSAMDRADRLVERFEKAVGVPLFQPAPTVRTGGRS
jgi:biotin carboxylase